MLFTHTKQDVDDRFDTPRLNETLEDIFNIPGTLSLIPTNITLDINFNRVSDRTDLEVYQNRELGQNVTVVYGASLRDDKVKSFYLFNSDVEQDVRTHRLFSSLDWRLGAGWILDLGLMLEETNYTDKELSNRISIIKKINQHSWRLVSSMAKRNPTLSEVIGDIQFTIDPLAFAPVVFIDSTGNPEIAPEKIQSYEIGLLSQYLDKTLTTDIKLFTYTISDQIQELKFTGSPQDYRVPYNVGETTAQGLELSLNFSPAHKTYRLYGGLSYVNAETLAPITGTAVGNPFSGTLSFPEKSAYAGGHINIGSSHQLSATLYYVDDVSWLDSKETIESNIKLDMRYQYLINRTYDTKLELIGYNLFEDFSDYSVENIQQKSFLLRVSTRF